ncbi:MAG: hypothetical protein QM503_02880 [Bacteroidota bacterium]
MSALKYMMLFVLLQNVAYAGWVITEESVDRFGNRSINTTFVQNNVIRYETPTSITIIDCNSSLITIVFSQYKVYWSGTSNEFKQSTMAIYDSQMESMVAGLSNRDRVELDSIYANLKEQMLDTVGVVYSSDMEVINTEDTLEIYGYNTTKYNVFIDTTLTESIWYTTEIKPYSNVDVDFMISSMKQLSLAPIVGSIAKTKEYLSLLKEGMIIKSIEYSPNENELETTVTNIREIEINHDFFLPPKNYRKAELIDILNISDELNIYEKNR